MNTELHKVTTNTFALFKNKIITLPYFNGVNYFNNIESFQIKLNNKETDPTCYVVYSNTILISLSKINERLLLHELIHMATANRKLINQMSYKMGYEVVTSKTKDVTALNEGLTQLLVCNAIDDNDSCNDIYPIETRIARILTYIFGENEVYKYFFKAEPESFVEDIVSKTKDNSIATLIVKMDELLSLLKTPTVTEFNKDCGILLYEAQKQLVDMFLKTKTDNNLDYDTFSQLLITTKSDNAELRKVANSCDMRIEEYLTNNIKQK